METRAGREKRWRLSMSLVLSVCFGTLITVSMAAVLGITVTGATRNTIDLLRKEAELGVSLVVREIDRHLAAARPRPPSLPACWKPARSMSTTARVWDRC